MTKAILANITAILGEHDNTTYFSISVGGNETQLAVPNDHEALAALTIDWEGMIEVWDRKRAKGPAKENHFRLAKIADKWTDFAFYEGPDLKAGSFFSEGGGEEPQFVIAVERDITAEKINQLAGENFIAERNLIGLSKIDPAAAHRTRVDYVTILHFLEEQEIVTIHAPMKIEAAWEPGVRLTVTQSETRPSGRRISMDEFEEHFLI